MTPEENNKLIRYPAFSGTWYPDDQKDLGKEIKKYLDQVSELKIDQKPRIILSPHPGLIFGGQTQAYSYKAISNFKYRNVFLIGVSHHTYLDSISLGDFDFYETPLGKINVNRDIISFLKNKNSRFGFEKEAHIEEHSLEIQLPFLQTVLDDFQIVPILLSGNNKEDSKILAKNLYEVITSDDLVVISTDLSHYPKYEDANKVDKETLKAILSLDIDIFEEKLKNLQNNVPQNTDTFACGEKAIISAIHLANKLNLKDAKILHYENSGDSDIADKNSVVGYGSLTVLSSEDERFSDTANLTKGEKDKALKIAKTSLLNYFTKEREIDFDIEENSILNKEFGAFVTLKMKGALRGCIGNFEANIPLYNLISKLALDSALRDTRFNPVTKDEVKDIQIEISVLSKMKKIETFHEIIPGKHGVYIQKGMRGGTYLPQVATEQNWNREEMLNSLAEHKSGLDKDCWEDGSAEMFVYTANVFGE